VVNIIRSIVTLLGCPTSTKTKRDIHSSNWQAKIGYLKMPDMTKLSSISGRSIKHLKGGGIIVLGLSWKRSRMRGWIMEEGRKQKMVEVYLRIIWKGKISSIRNRVMGYTIKTRSMKNLCIEILSNQREQKSK
jgi:hypothetical protein